jgi:hypothetical protein
MSMLFRRHFVRQSSVRARLKMHSEPRFIHHEWLGGINRAYRANDLALRLQDERGAGRM